MQRYEEFSEVIKTNSGKRRYATLYYPKFERKTSDIYLIAKKSDRLDLLAHKYYGDPRYWVIIARANNLHNATIRIIPGRRIRIPYPLNSSDIEQIFLN